jgi:dihydropteroate synthase
VTGGSPSLFMQQLAHYRFGTRTWDFSTRAYVMGVLNVTPDSFSDGGEYLDPDIAVQRGLTMVEEGADCLDIGGESTRPRGVKYGEGAKPVSADEEADRVLPVIRELARRTDIPISIDTYKAAVARQALAAGACIVNDVSGFALDPAMPGVVAEAGASAVVMHMRGTPQTMQRDTRYEDLFGEILVFLQDSLRKGRAAGITQLIVDPGIGFGKTGADNLRLIAGAERFQDLGVPVLMGPSRKGFIGDILGTGVDDRLEGTLAAAVICAGRRVNILRVHDVRAVKRALLVADAIYHAQR